MDSQDSRFTTPPPDYGNLYDADTPPSAQPRSPPLSLPDSQKTTQSWDSRNSPRPQINESQHSTQSWDARDLLPDSQLLPDSLFESIPSPPLFIPDSQAEPELSPLRPHVYTSSHVECTRDKRLQIQIALLFKIPWAQIKEILDVSDSQITHAKTHRLTPQKTKAGRHAKLHTPEKTTLKEWLLSSPSHRHVAYHKIPHFLPQLYASEKAIRTAIDGIDYYRRVSRKKGLDLAEDGSTWPRSRIQQVCFIDEVWAFGGAHTNSFWQDNASSHHSYETKLNLLLRHIPIIQAPRYSPDLNLIEHIWNWMKNWIEEHYWEACYQPDKIRLDQLRKIIQDAWDAVPDEYIQGLYDSWWRRCEAVKEAHGGPTKY
ncbi:uncharacterized protein K444DRAFT_618308 [Hyaloscypha bicolor E]|uniref:Tc1-like transposase DDE domain-containing protein n=1 Tax=Hyaloscypha bicolor E TaxID=1095630 RepID=A0A2J6SST2_9HELO|nr:uncharacterized protein K444DRAFT_618308 [Hyaloscypha bicolor E]PMD53827.1 hypothetical protein K444DRAFT_618308 [Hyaloscypha bicolor E]